MTRNDSGIRIGAATVHGILRESIVEVVLELAEAGFETFELVDERGKPFSETEIDELKRMKKEFSMHGPFTGMMPTHPNPEYWKPQLERIDRSIETARNIGCSDYILHAGEIPYAYWLAGKPREFFVDSFVERVAPLVAKYSKIKIRIENLVSEREIGTTYSELARIIDAIPNLGLCYDVAHAVLAHQADEIIRRFKIDYIHVTDNNLQDDQHNALGTGVIDFGTIMRSVKPKGCKQTIIVEAKSAEADRISMSYLRRLFKERQQAVLTCQG